MSVTLKTTNEGALQKFMKQFRLIIAAAFIAGVLVVANAEAQPATNRSAQQSPTNTTAGTIGAPQTTPGAVLLAVVNTAQFEDPQRGIQRLVAASQTLQREFQPQIQQIQQLQTQLQTLANQIQQTQPLAQEAEILRRRSEAEQLQTRITRAQEDLRAASNRRAVELIVPINRDIATSLEAFARGRNITVVFDISRLGEVMFVTSPTIDITNDFVADYNRRNPATVAPATTTPATTTPATTTPTRPQTQTPGRRP
jgi:Skp family chaperone for outer membrane proteins